MLFLTPNVMNAMIFGSAALLVPQIPGIALIRVKNEVGTFVQELTRSNQVLPFNLRVTDTNKNAMGKTQKYSLDGQNWRFGRI
eukprot:GDKH01003732.1.p3 GENE.GDKH01003732.1~~GDKH01003732.1.p3  ORF type:complete len:83 (+),score=13.07 GDKH01003732.1:229-477(+)